MFEWVLVLFSLVHGLIFLFLHRVFVRLRVPSHSNDLSFSIIVPIRNEEKNLIDLMNSLEKITYPRGKFEVILVDDSSEDRGVEFIHSGNWSFSHRVFKLPDGHIGKKAAIELGVRESQHEIIVTTDGDCQVSPNWLTSINEAFSPSDQMIVGPVSMNPSNFFGDLQAFEFSMLVGYAAALVGIKKPATSNGANLAYRKEVFYEVNGYDGNRQVPSGDDEFLLHKVSKKHPSGISFLKDSRGLVFTTAKGSFNEFLNQRVRWLSKWRLHNNLMVILSVLFALTDNVLVIWMIVALTIGKLPAWILACLGWRILTKIIYSSAINKLLVRRENYLAVLVFEFIYPFYVLLLSFASIFGHYTWKGRQYK